jgi:hypothetical protein
MTIELENPSSGPGAAGPAAGPIWDRPYRPTWMRLLNGVGGGLRRAGLRWPRLDSASFLAAAERRAGLSDWGDDGFREGLRALIESFEAQNKAHTFGRLFFREYCLNILTNRLRIQAELKRHPEILDTPIRRPLVITGLPRSGTTLLHRLMCEDPGGRPLLFWEALEPVPSPRYETRLTDPRIARARKSVGLLNALAPRIRAAHLFDAESPEECNNLFAHGFIAGINGFMFDVPQYVEWMREQDLIEPYRHLRRQLQLLSWRWPGDPWLLKAPAHLFGLGSLLAIFPDACIVQIHRDPLQVLPSLCSLAAAVRGITSDHVDLRRLGAEFAEAMARGTDRAIDARAAADPARYYDVSYPTLLADPVGTVRAVRRHFGYSYDNEFEARMKRWLAENPQHKHGVHRYSLEQFGLEPEVVNRWFARYNAWVAEHVRPTLT